MQHRRIAGIRSTSSVSRLLHSGDALQRDRDPTCLSDVSTFAPFHSRCALAFTPGWPWLQLFPARSSAPTPPPPIHRNASLHHTTPQHPLICLHLNKRPFGRSSPPPALHVGVCEQQSSGLLAIARCPVKYGTCVGTLSPDSSLRAGYERRLAQTSSRAQLTRQLSVKPRRLPRPPRPSHRPYSRPRIALQRPPSSSPLVPSRDDRCWSILFRPRL